MRTFQCSCGETLFFDNTSCASCGAQVGFCPVCRSISPLHGSDENGFTCGNPSCRSSLIRCYNYRVEKVCNRCVAVEPAGEPLCDCCRYNETIPNLTVPGNREKWRRLEAAKRRLFYQLDMLRMPRGKASEGFDPPLAFDFKDDIVRSNSGMTCTTGEHETVMTGHANGRITINIQEADPVERERLRVQFNESHRSLIGHFRHEIAHYYWDLFVKNKDEQSFKATFGDHEHPTYAESLERYYTAGPPSDWANRYPSAYASMHPWEDFAETFVMYLEMVGTLDTAHHTELGEGERYKNLDEMIEAYHKLGVAMNVMNRTMGLKDHLTRPLVPPVVDKLRYVHALVQRAQSAGRGTANN